MKSDRYVFLSHYRKVSVEGEEPGRLLNHCMISGLEVRNIEYISAHEIAFFIRDKDFRKLKSYESRGYRIKVCGEGGFSYKCRLFWNNKALILGLGIFMFIVIYQSMFIHEISVNGYESYNEQELRMSMREAGLYEGCRKTVDLNKVKLHLYDNYGKITWIGIKYKGNLAEVNIAEADYTYEKYTVSDDKPCCIIADKSGYVERVYPEEGLSCVKKGSYVREGDMIISGIIPVESTDYSDETKDKERYVHASGFAEAKVPLRLNFYEYAYEMQMKKTGKRLITITVNDHELVQCICNYKTALVQHKELMDLGPPFNLKIGLNYIDEIKINYREISDKQAKNEAIDQIHKFVKEKLPDNAQILNKSLNFTREKNIINIGVTLETLQKIGIEEEIIVDKSNRQSEEDDDQ